MAAAYTDLADLIEKNEAVALDQLRNESDVKQRSKSELSNDERRSERVGRSRGGESVHRSPQHSEYMDERAENDKRRLRRSRDMSDDDGRTHSDRDSASGSTRDRRPRRSQSPTKSDRRAYRDREYGSRGDLRDSYRPGDRRGDRRGEDDSYRPDSDRRRRDREYEGRDRARDRSRDRGDRRGGRDSRDSRDSRRRRSPTPNKEDSNDRDERTVFVQQIAQSCSSSKLQKFFEQVGAVVDAQIVKDRVSGRSKGVGYVEFRQKESVEKALGLTGQKINGVPIIVQQTEAEKNRQPRNTTGGQPPANGAPFHRLYVGNIHFSVTEDDLRSIFGPFGNLEFVQIQKEEATGRSRGYGFVQYSDPGCAKQALEKLNGFELAKRPIRVGLGNDRFTDSSTKSLLQASSQQFQGSDFSGAGGRGAYAGGTGNFDRAAREADKTGAGSALDDSDVGGVNMSNYNRYELIRKLARTENDEVKAPTQTVTQKPVDQPQTATRCVVLRHLYDPATMTDAAEQKELEDDVLEECKARYGEVVHIGLNLDSTEGEVYLKFKDLQGSKNAIQGLNGRFFGGSQITASYIVDAIYNTNFPKAANS